MHYIIYFSNSILICLEQINIIHIKVCIIYIYFSNSIHPFLRTTFQISFLLLFFFLFFLHLSFLLLLLCYHSQIKLTLPRMRKSHLTSNLSERDRERERVLAEVKQKKVSRDLFIIIINLTFKTRCEVFHLCIIQEKLYKKNENCV